MGRVERFKVPPYRPFAPECRACGCCGHNRLGHARFMREFPAIARMPECERTWKRGSIQHSCVWCAYYPWWVTYHARRVAESERAAASEATEPSLTPDGPPQ
jgi:ssDNA-binding Zn-finger/Zn-ribbon topoisomerase 1